MKRILLSVAVIAAVAAVVVGVTTAFFSDTETSTGNTFTAGSLDLKIDSKCSYNGVPGGNGQCGVWDLKDLGTISPTGAPSVESDKFFNFSDLKPGDIGENTISFHIYKNDAWMCAAIKNVNQTGGTSTEPELAVDPDNSGDLGNYLNILWWVDDGDNVLETGEKVLYGGPKTLNAWLALGGGSVLPLTFADSYLNWKTWDAPWTPGNATPVPGDTTQYLGVGWCFGNMTIGGGAYGFTCDGSGAQNDAQGDTITADIEFYIEQHRNNAGFLCPEHLGWKS